MTTGRTVTFDAFYPAPLDVWVEVRAVPETTTSGQALGLYFLDIHARKNAQAAAEAAAARAHLLAACDPGTVGHLGGGRGGGAPGPAGGAALGTGA